VSDRRNARGAPESMGSLNRKRMKQGRSQRMKQGRSQGVPIMLSTSCQLFITQTSPEGEIGELNRKVTRLI
jgi:hypothetical protein